MKNTIELAINDKKYKLGFTILDMRNIEREIGRSLISVLNPNTSRLVQSFDIDCTVACLRHGLHDKLRTDDEVYDLITDYCKVNSLDSLCAVCFQALIDTGIFLPASALKNAPTDAPVKPEKPSRPSKNG
jgi:hypothetical protein